MLAGGYPTIDPGHAPAGPEQRVGTITLTLQRRSQVVAAGLATGERVDGAALARIILAQADLQAFARLSDEQRALLLLVSVEGLSYKEAAHALGIPIGTVMSRLSRARAALRELTEGNPQPPALRRLK